MVPVQSLMNSEQDKPIRYQSITVVLRGNKHMETVVQELVHVYGYVKYRQSNTKQYISSMVRLVTLDIHVHVILTTRIACMLHFNNDYYVICVICALYVCR